jgi:enoyl-CoA hydratase
MSSFHTLFTKMEDHTLIITINRPDKLNALNQQVMKDLDAVMDRVYKFPEIKSVVITGAGLKSFVAGADAVSYTHLRAHET